MYIIRALTVLLAMFAGGSSPAAASHTATPLQITIPYTVQPACARWQAGWHATVVPDGNPTAPPAFPVVCEQDGPYPYGPHAFAWEAVPPHHGAAYRLRRLMRAVVTGRTVGIDGRTYRARPVH